MRRAIITLYVDFENDIEEIGVCKRLDALTIPNGTVYDYEIQEYAEPTCEACGSKESTWIPNPRDETDELLCDACGAVLAVRPQELQPDDTALEWGDYLSDTQRGT